MMHAKMSPDPPTLYTLPLAHRARRGPTTEHCGRRRLCAAVALVALAHCGDGEMPDAVVDRASCRTADYCDMWIAYRQSALTQPMAACARDEGRWSTARCPPEGALGTCVFVTQTSDSDGRITQRTQTTYQSPLPREYLEAECRNRGGGWASSR